MTDEELIAMARLAQRDDRMATGALYGDLADRIEALLDVRDTLRRLLAKQTARAERLEAALRWYEARVADCRKITRKGDTARHELDRDGGKIAYAALKGADHD